MKCEEIVKAVSGEQICLCNPYAFNKDVSSVFATDLMSDALAMITNYEDSTVLLTGLVNAQSLRTAEMLDINLIIYVRGKRLNDSDLDLAKEMGFNIFSTKFTMYEACGLLYQKGLKPPSE